MKKSLRKLTALLLGIVLVVTLLPAATAAGSNPRDVVVGQAEAIASVPFTMEERFKKGDVADARLTAFQEGGILPATYFEYVRLKFPLRGVIMDVNHSSLEQFKGMMTGETQVEGYGQIPERSVYKYLGMDMNSFLVDLISRVSPEFVGGFDQALSDNALIPLISGINLNTTSSKAALGSDSAAAYAAYDKLEKGDLLLAYDRNADTTTAPTKHVLVVKDVDAANDKVTVIYPGYSLVVWHFQCDTCGATDTEGPTSAALPGHINSTASYSFASFKKHADTHNVKCKGSWSPLYGTTWREMTVSYAELFQDGITAGSVGYLPYTLAAYSAEAPVPVEVKLTTSTTAESIAIGFNATVTSNYRIAQFEAVLERKGGETLRFVSTPNWDSWTWEYSDPALNQVLMSCAPGDYTLSLNVLSGPVTDAQTLSVPSNEVFKMDFHLGEPTFKLTTQAKTAQQGEKFTLALRAIKAGNTSVDATVSFDANRYMFNADATRAANPSVTFTDNGDGTLSLSYRGATLKADQVVANLIFSPKRTGNDPMKKDELTPFVITALSGASGGPMVAMRPDTTPLYVEIGLNTYVYKNYAGGKDLVLVYMRNDDLADHSTLDVTYGGKLMYEVTDSHYSIDGDSFICIFGYITSNADATKVAVGGGVNCPEITYSTDVNDSGYTDMNDAQIIANIYNGKLPLDGNEIKWLRADINRDNKVDVNDQIELMKSLMN